MDPVTIIGLTLIFFYSLRKILSFYGVSQSTYGVYMLFYMFLCLCIVVLPKNEPEF